MNMEHTKRKMLIGVIIFFLMITAGIFISDKISEHVAAQNEVYYKAVKIDNNADQFTYAMRTNLGVALIYGALEASDGVKLPELTGKYWAVERVTEKYTQHIRIITTTDSEGKTHTRTEFYNSWDIVSSEESQTEMFHFLGNVFESDILDVGFIGKIPLNEETVTKDFVSKINGNYIYEDSGRIHSIGDLRYSYNYFPEIFCGSILAKLEDDTLQPIHENDKAISLIYEKKISEIIEEKQNSESAPMILFWIVWIFLTGGAIAWFCIRKVT